MFRTTAEKMILGALALWATVATCMYDDHADGLDLCFDRVAAVEDSLSECKAEALEAEYDCDMRVASACDYR